MKRPELSTEEKKELFLLTYPLTGQNISEACRMAGIHRQTYYLWIDSDTEFAANIDDLDGATTDEILSILVESAKTGSWKALKYYLDHKGTKRGFGRKAVKSDALPSGSYHVHYHQLPEPKSLSDWEQQVQDARKQRLLSDKSVININATIEQDDTLIENESQ
jgi:hypothetical protein